MADAMTRWKKKKKKKDNVFFICPALMNSPDKIHILGRITAGTSDHPSDLAVLRSTRPLDPSHFNTTVNQADSLKLLHAKRKEEVDTSQASTIKSCLDT